MKLLQKMKGDAQQLPPLAPKRGMVLAGLGGVIAISLLGLLGATTQTALVLGSFGASCVLLFGFPDVPFSQPRNIVAGHFLSSLIGLAFLKLLGPSWGAMGLAAGTAISVMMVTRTVHPPAGSNPVIVFLSQPSWGFLLFPTLIGASVLVLVGLLFHNSTREARYPKYWLGSRLEPLFRLSTWKTIVSPTSPGAGLWTSAGIGVAALTAFIFYFQQPKERPEPVTSGTTPLVQAEKAQSEHSAGQPKKGAEPPIETKTPPPTGAANRADLMESSAAEPLALEPPFAPTADLSLPIGESKSLTATEGYPSTHRIGPIERGAQLWPIASALRDTFDATIDQVMVGLFETNPESFCYRNLNCLKVGAYLDPPSANRVGAITPSQARRTVQRQSETWLERNRRTEAVADTKPKGAIP
jgi:FimV-like protein